MDEVLAELPPTEPVLLTPAVALDVELPAVPVLLTADEFLETADDAPAVCLPAVADAPVPTPELLLRVTEAGPAAEPVEEVLLTALSVLRVAEGWEPWPLFLTALDAMLVLSLELPLVLPSPVDLLPTVPRGL